MSLKNENLFILFLWWFVFMVVLPWDQEKIVVLNLVLFAYFIKYMAGDSINGALMQKKETILEILKTELLLGIKLLSNLSNDVFNIEKNYSIFILLTIKKYLNNLIDQVTKNLQAGYKNISTYSLVFSFILNNFSTIYKTLVVLEGQKNILASKFLLSSTDEYFIKNN